MSATALASVENYQEVLDIREEEVQNNSAASDVNFDLFNLNFKNSDAESIFKEKKLVNINKKQKIVSSDNKVVEAKVDDNMNFSFQQHNEEINYHDAFRDLRMENNMTKPARKFENGYNNNSPTTSVDLKNKLYSAGYKIRTYQKQENENFYAMRYYLSNKLNKDCSILAYICMIIFVGIMWLSFDNLVKLPIYTYLGIMGAFFALPLVNIIKHVVSPNKRKKTNFNFKLTFLNVIMVYLLGLVVCLLVSFFALGAELNNFTTLVVPLVYPMFCMLVMPIYSILYQILYASKKYVVE